MPPGGGQQNSTDDGYQNSSDGDGGGGTTTEGYIMFNPSTNTGVASKIGAGQEPIPGVAVMPTGLVDRTSGNLEMQLATIDRQTLRNTPSPVGAVPGAANTDGGINIEPTPEGLFNFLAGTFGAPSSGQRTVPSYPTNVTSTVFGTPASVSKNYKIVAMNSQGDSLPSLTTGVTTAGAFGGANYVELRWNSVLDAVFYKILTETSVGSGTFDKLIATIKQCVFWDFGATPTSYTAFTPAVPTAPSAPTGVFTGTPGSTTFHFKLVATNYMGDSALSTATDIATATATLNGTNFIDLTWAAVAGIVSNYKILMSIGAGAYALVATVDSNTLSYRVASNTTTAYVAQTNIVYKHVYSHGFNQTSLTLTEKRGSLYYAFPGVKTNSMQVKVDKTQTEPFNLAFNMDGLRENSNFTAGALGIDAVGYDIKPAFGPTQCAVVLGGAYHDEIKSFDVTINNNLGKRDSLTQLRGPVSHFIQRGVHSGTMSLYFSDKEQIERYFGLTVGQVVQIGGTNNIVFHSLYLIVTSEKNTQGFFDQFIFEFPFCTYTRVGEPITGPDAIMQECAFNAYTDPTLQTSCRVWMINSQSPATVIQVGTPISGYLHDAVNPYMS